jgi:hypothetical protein
MSGPEASSILPEVYVFLLQALQAQCWYVAG